MASRSLSPKRFIGRTESFYEKAMALYSGFPVVRANSGPASFRGNPNEPGESANDVLDPSAAPVLPANPPDEHGSESADDANIEVVVKTESADDDDDELLDPHEFVKTEFDEDAYDEGEYLFLFHVFFSFLDIFLANFNVTLDLFCSQLLPLLFLFDKA